MTEGWHSDFLEYMIDYQTKRFHQVKRRVGDFMEQVIYTSGLCALTSEEGEFIADPIWKN
jgi:hypothetical protein